MTATSKNELSLTGASRLTSRPFPAVLTNSQRRSALYISFVAFCVNFVAIVVPIVGIELGVFWDAWLATRIR